MPNLRVSTTLQYLSLVPEDSVVNTIYVQTPVGFTNYSDIGVAVWDFYQALVNMYPDTINDDGHAIRIYDMADPKPRVPVYENESLAFPSAPSGAPLPSEVAITLSFQATAVSGTNQARRRGRIYLGPLDVNQVTSAGRVQSATRTLIANSASALLDDLGAITGGPVLWVVRSEVGDSYAPVNNGWVDDAFDIQRRRGLAPSVRTTWS